MTLLVGAALAAPTASGAANVPAPLAALLQQAQEGRGLFPSGTLHPATTDTIASPQLADDFVVAAVQWVFQRPPWVMWGGVLLGALIAGSLLLMLWRHREEERAWLGLRTRHWWIGLGAATAAFGIVAALAGYKSYDFVMNDKRFCQGCHIFVPSGVVMAHPKQGSFTLVNRLEGKHDTLGCHACHTLNPVAEGVKMVFWMSGRRDEEMPPHSKVPRAICEQCHVKGAASKSWQAIRATAGHRVHFESDSSALRNVQCLTCHARSAHRFQPPDTTCAQKGCHLTGAIQIKLGKMAGQAQAHCATCHAFTRDVPRLAGLDSAKSTLVPGQRQCFGCHEMRAKLALFDPSRDPHKARCGDCHNPHAQVQPKDALKTCASVGCHADWRQVDFHVGKAHARIGQNCEACHEPHSARVDASDCTGCHERARGSAAGKALRRLPPVMFDTAKAVKKATVSGLFPDEAARAVHGKGDGPADEPPPPEPPERRAAAAPAPATQADSFAHARHTTLPCLTCHSVASKTSKLTFEAPRGCQACHHQDPAKADCTRCHAGAELNARRFPQTLVVTLASRKAAPRSRGVIFSHAAHTSAACIDCHRTAVTLAATPAAQGCTDCHDQHHANGTACAECHRTDAGVAAHKRPLEAHVACSTCHPAATVAQLAPVRSFCLTCHEPKTDHYRAAQCTACHFQASPDAFRPALQGGWAARTP